MYAIIMIGVIRTMTFVAAVIFAGAPFGVTPAAGQVPPGVPYNPEKHPNPIVTYLNTRDFKPTTYAGAQTVAGFDPLGLSEKEGKRLSIEFAQPKPATQKIALPDDEFPLIKVEFYPVVRQKYMLKDGEILILDGFRFPKVPIPLNVITGVLNTAAFQPGDKYRKGRFGPATVPERVIVRGLAALLFDDNKEFVLFWREGSECYVAKTKAPRVDLFRMINDLL